MKIGNIKKKLIIALSGTALAQIIHLLITPILTRIYSPDEFGQLALLISFSGLATAIATLKLDIAIVIADNNEQRTLDAFIWKFSFIFSIILFLFSGVIFASGYTQYAILSAFLAVLTFLRSPYQSKRSILNAKGKYKEISIGKIIENVSNGSLALLFGLFKLEQIGLLIAKSLSFLIPLVYYKKKVDPIVKDTELLDSKETISKYKNFPKLSVISTLVNQLDINFFTFGFLYLYSQSTIGFLSMTSRVLSLPINFIGLAFLDVFREKAAHDIRVHGECRTTFVKFLLTLLALSLVLFLVINSFGVFLFKFILGTQWEQAGVFAEIAIFYYCLRLVSSPLGFMYSLRDKQKLEMFFKFFILFCSVLTILFAQHFQLNENECLKYYVGVMSIIDIIYIFIAFTLSKVKN